jgi:hypothetical protein
MVKKLLPDTYTFLIAAALGIGLGGILSYLFGSVALPTNIASNFTVIGLSSGLFLTNLIIVIIVAAIAFLGYVSAIVQDTAFPAKHPDLFAVETALVALIPATVIFIMSDFRDNGKIDLSTLNRDYLFLAAKFGIFHLLFQFSGIYTYFFPMR